MASPQHASGARHSTSTTSDPADTRPPIAITIFFLIYWQLPNGKVKASRILPAAVVVGLLWKGAKYVYIVALPWLNFPEAYGPFSISVTLMLWAFLSGLLLLAGARLSATRFVVDGNGANALEA